MRIAILTDIHANREAFEAVLADATARGATQFAILGDIVGYGGDPGWCVERTMALAKAGGVVVRGNHDQAVYDPSISLNETARAAIQWTARQLSPEHAEYLATLPLTVREGDRLYVHSSAAAPGRFNYLLDTEDASGHFAACDARLGFCGHVHRPRLYSMGAGKVCSFAPTGQTPIPLLAQRRWVAVVGSVGQPRDGDPAAGYAIYDTQTCELCFHKAAYDIEAASAKIRAAGLPDSLAQRLLTGK